MPHRIPEETVERLKRKVSLVRLVESQGHLLVRQGKDLVCRCPWHAGDETPSCVISVKSNLWHCFGCNAGGSVIDWVMRWNKVSFRHACELMLKEHDAITASCDELRMDPAKQGWRGARPAADWQVCDDAEQLMQVMRFYHESMMTATQARDYLAQRKLDDRVLIEHFQLGFGNRTLAYRLAQGTVKSGEAVRRQLRCLGILRASSGHEHLNGCVVVPLFNEQGQVVQMYGRKINYEPRSITSAHLYLSGEQRGIFNVRGLLDLQHALSLLDRPVDVLEVIVCEALLDALTFWRFGFRNVTSTFGVHGVKEDLLGLLQRLRCRVLIAFDRDEAGDRGAEALAQKLRERGLECFRLLLPQGMDVNEYACSVDDPAYAFSEMIRGAVWMDGSQPSKNAELVIDSENESPAENVSPRDASFSLAAHQLVARGQWLVDREKQAVEKANAEKAEKIALTEEKNDLGIENTNNDLPVLNAVEKAPVISNQQASIVKQMAHQQPVPVQMPARAVGALPEPDTEATQTEREVSMQLGDRRYRVRGLVRNTSFDVLRVNVLVSNKGSSDADHLAGMYVDTLDLYVSKARQQYAKQAAVELGVEESVMQRDLGRLLLKLEELQEQIIQEALQPKAAAVPEMTAAQRDAAMRFLQDSKLMQHIVADFERIGLVGEPNNALVGYLACVSRKLKQPLAVIVQSTSAAGKSALMDSVLSLMPEEENIHYSAMTGQSLFYLGEKDIKHKILAIAEEEGVRQAAYALKLLQSQGELTMASTGKDPQTGMLVTQEYRVEGPVMLFLTTTAIDIDEELLNRCLVLTIDESREQTRRIQQQQRSKRTLAGLLVQQDAEAARHVHRCAQRLLRPLAVVNPYAEQLTFLDERTRTRRDHQKYLTLIDSIALLHQYQRQTKTIQRGGQTLEYIEVTPADIALANQLAADVLSRSLDELPPQTRHLLQLVDDYVAKRSQQQGVTKSEVRFTRRELREDLRWGDTQLKVHLARLEDAEFLVVHRQGHAQRYHYELLYSPTEQISGACLVGLLDAKTEISLNPNNLSDGMVENIETDGTAINPVNQSVFDAKQSGVGRGVVGGQSATGRDAENISNTLPDKALMALRSVDADLNISLAMNSAAM